MVHHRAPQPANLSLPRPPSLTHALGQRHLISVVLEALCGSTVAMGGLCVDLIDM